MNDRKGMEADGKLTANNAWQGKNMRLIQSANSVTKRITAIYEVMAGKDGDYSREKRIERAEFQKCDKSAELRINGAYRRNPHCPMDLELKIEEVKSSPVQRRLESEFEEMRPPELGQIATTKWG